MKLAMFVNPLSDQNLSRAAQVGVTDLVIPYPGTDVRPLQTLRKRIESFGMRMTHIERKLPHLELVHNGPGRRQQLDSFIQLIRNMAETGMEVLCYNWMPDEDWQRTRSDVQERGGSKVTAFAVNEIGRNVTDADGLPPQRTPASDLWRNLQYFLEEVLPVAEECGIKLALHPDDPPLPVLNGQDRIIVSNRAYQKVLDLVPSPCNGICYCVGSFQPAGEDLLAGIRQLHEKIFFFHARNVRGVSDNFQETWPDIGEIDMPAVFRTLKEVGYTGAVRPDHAPSMAGESNETPGYEMLGRLYAAGYLKGLMQA